MRDIAISLLMLFVPGLVLAQEPADTTLVINEIQVSNNGLFIDNSFCYGSWIEIYNPTSASISLKGMYISNGVTDHRLLTTHGSVAPGGFKTIWFDHYQTQGNYGSNSRLQIPFKLEYEGGTISLLDIDKTLLSTVEYPQAISRCSYARTKDGGDAWGVTSDPTPGESNATSRFSTRRMAAPVVDTDSRIFTNAFEIRVKIPTAATLRYTTDGSIPTATHGETSTDGRFTISKTTILRFCLLRNNYLSSPVVTRSYIYQNHPYYLPVISVVSQSENFFDNKIGIFVKGTNGISGNGQNDACNWNMDWERPVNVEYLVPEKDQGGNVNYVSQLNMEADLEICGGWSRGYGGGSVDGRYWPTRSSFRIKTDKRYEGVGSIDCQVFPLKPYNKYRCWQVRNGGNDTRARIIDPALQQIVLRSGFYVDCQDYQPAHVFLNGEYYGMLNIRESNNKHYGYSNYGIDLDDMDQFDLSNSQYNQKLGDNKAWTQLLKYASTLASTKTEEAYEKVCEMLDIDEYVNYMALECYMGPTDWITNTNNVKGFRSRTDGKFHFVLFDTDSAFGASNMLSQVLSTSGGANVDDLFRYLMRYEPFRRQFIDAFCLVDGSVFEPTRCEAIIREIYSNINPALNFEGYSSNTNLINTIRSSYNGIRVESVGKYYNIAYSLYADISANIPEARLSVNGQEIPTGKFAGTLFSYGNRPISVVAKAPAGYNFVGWQTENRTATTTTLIPDNSTWMYYDQGSMDGRAWKSPTFSEAQNGWKEGTAPFGYANAGYYMQENSATKLDYGTDKSKKRPTYYFRKTFDLATLPSESATLTFNYQVDDGMMLYVNGREVGGYYVTSGSSYSDYTTGGHYEGAEPHSGSIAIPHDYLVKGVNQIAVEIKNTSAASTDMWFEANLTLTSKEGSFVTNTDAMDLHELYDNNTQVILKAVFEPIEGEQQQWAAGSSPLRINEVSSDNDIYINEYGKKSDWVELYNTTDKDIELSGLYLSDSRRKPQKFQLQEGVVPAHGTCVVWCDGTEGNGLLHAPFKLDNSDGSCVSIQAEDGSWADCMEYTEQGRWQTFGRYPDGGNMTSLLNQPTIDKSNKLGFVDFYAVSDDGWMGADRTIILALAEGWNWTSHNLSVGVDQSRFISNALCLRNQTDESILDTELGWIGSLRSMEPAQGYKLKMQTATDITLRGPLFDVNTPVALQKGWNWVGCPLYNATNLEAALANYTPEEGDKVIGQDAFATYEGGEWHGSLTSLQPGQSYLFYAGKEQEFCWQSLSPMRSGVRRYAPAVQTQDEAWQTDIHAYPNVMTLVANVQTDGQIDTDGRYYVGAFCGDECRGVGFLDGDLLYMNIHGDEACNLTFRLLDAQGDVYESSALVSFQSYQQLGSVAQPYQLIFGDADIQDVVRPDIATATAPIRRIEYYNLSGQRVSLPASGVLIRRTIYQDGRVENTKVMEE